MLASSLGGLGDWPSAALENTGSLVQRAEAGEVLRVIVQVGDSTAGALVSAQASEHGATIVHQFERFPLIVMEVDARALQAVLESPSVVSLAEDELLAPALDASLPVINAPQAHGLGWDGGGVAVAVLDTGIDRNHPFFAGRVVEEACFSNSGGAGGGVSLCPNGQSSQTGVGAANSNSTGCLNGTSNMCTHGPHVAGIAAGNGAGVSGAPAAGVAPGGDIIAIQVFTRYNTTEACNGTAPCLRASFSDLIQGLEHALVLSDDYTVAAANMSLGGSTYSSACDAVHPPTTTAIDNLRAANIATVVASGNSSKSDQISIPACISSAISVGSTDNSDVVASFGNRGPLLDLFAPGVSIRSAVNNNGYGTKSGTSMSTPHVAGAWAALRQVRPALSVTEIVTLLQDTGKPITYSSGGTNVTTPRIDLLAAAQAAADLGDIHGYKWHDLNGDGVWDDGEPALAGWTVYLDQNDNSQHDSGEPTAVTGADGAYAFLNLSPGDYVVRELGQFGYEQTFPGLNPGTFWAAAYGDHTDGKTQLARIDADTGQVHRAAQLMDQRMHGMVVTNDGRVLGVNGSDDSLYEVDPTSGAISLIGPSGWELHWGLAYDPATDTIYGSGRASGSEVSRLLVFDRNNGSAAPVGQGITGTSAVSGLTFDRANQRILLFSNDTNQFYAFDTQGNGTEVSVLGQGVNTWSLTSYEGGVAMGLTGTRNNEILFVNPDTGASTGSLFLSEPAAAESLEFVPGAAYGHRIVLHPGAVISGKNFGSLAASGEVRGFKWHDLNGNGAWDVGESPLADWEIFLDLNENGQWDDGEPKTVTGADGSYALTGLPAGTYTVAEVMQDGWVQTSPGSDDSMGGAGQDEADDAYAQLARDLAASLTTTDSPVPMYGTSSFLAPGDMTFQPQTNLSGPLINLDAFRADPRFSDVAGQGYSIVVLDSGLNLTHPFFGDRIVHYQVFTDEPAGALDGHGHGTNVTSIAASQDAIYPGVAPGVNIIHLKVLRDDNGGFFSWMEQALQWVVANAATYKIAAVNMSIGDGGNYNTAQSRYGLGDELAALATLNIIVSTSAGNGFYTASSVPGVAYPAADPNTLAVGAVFDADIGTRTYSSGAQMYSSAADRITPFSQRHAVLSEIFAPGAAITGASNVDSGTKTFHGTSQASPHVAGATILAQQLAEQYLGRRLSLEEFRGLLGTAGVMVNDGDDEDDNVVNTGLNFPRLDMLALGEAILALQENAVPGDGVWYVTLEDSAIVEDVNFGNRNSNEITVTTLDDRIDPNDGLISLREAILLANGAVGNITILLGEGTHGLTIEGAGEDAALTGDLDILPGHPVTIRGAGTALTVIDTVGRFADRVLHVLNGSELHIEALSVTGGNVQGNGGGIFNQGTLSLLDTVVSENVGDYGGGIRSAGQLSIQQSTISGNTSRQTGGGISNYGGQLQVVASTISGNSATYGGGLWTNSTATISDSTFADNLATPNNGGAISNASGGTLRIERSTLAGNTANYGGAILTNAPLVIINSTLSGNAARTSGGAIHNQNSLTMYHSTVHGNRANSEGTTSGAGGGISRSTGTIELYHTIVAGNLMGTGDTPQEINGLVESTSAFNLIADAGSSGGLIDGINGNIVGNGGTGTVEASEILSPTLADYGGPTLTHALIPTSPAIDVGNPDFDPASFDPPLLTDQRGEGFARVLQDHIDIGAFEYLLPYVETAVAVGSSVNPSIYGESVFFTATVSANTGTPTGTVQFAVSGIDLGAPMPLVDGVAQSPAVSDLTATTHTITAQYVPQLASTFIASSSQLAGGQLVNLKALTVSGITAADKVYDGTPDAVLDVSGVVLMGRIGDDDVVLDASSAAGAFEDSEVGSNKTVFVSGLVITGDDTVNYSLIQPTTTASILASAAARIEMTIVREPTATDGKGEVAILPDSAVWVHEWQTFWVELWVSTPDTTTLGVAEAMVDLAYDTDYLTAQELFYGPAFLQAQTGTIDDVAGLVSEIGARTASTDIGDDAHVLLARVRFNSTGNDQSPVNETGRSIGPYDMQMALSDGRTVLLGGGVIEAQLGQSPSTELWAVVYDIDDNHQIDFGDHSFFAAAFGHTVGDSLSEPPYAWWADFDKSDRVDFGDLAFFAPNFSKSRSAVQSGEKTLIFPSNFPDAWRAASGGGEGAGQSESEGESESESESEGKGEGDATSHAAAWALSADGVPVAASSGGSQDALALPWQLVWAVDEAHAALQMEQMQDLRWRIAAEHQAQPALPLWQESLGSLYSRSDFSDAAPPERPHRWSDRWEPLEDLLSHLSDQPSDRLLIPHDGPFTQAGR